MQEQLKDIGGKDKPISINAVNTEKEKAKPASKKAQCRCANTAVESTKQSGPNVQHTACRCREPNHFHTVCLKGTRTKPIATMEETELSQSQMNWYTQWNFVVESPNAPITSSHFSKFNLIIEAKRRHRLQIHCLFILILHSRMFWKALDYITS